MRNWYREWFVGKQLFPNDRILLNNLQRHASDEAPDDVVENWYRQFFIQRPRQAMEGAVHRLWRLGYILVRPTGYYHCGLVKRFSVSLTARGEQAARYGKYV